MRSVGLCSGGGAASGRDEQGAGVCPHAKRRNRHRRRRSLRFRRGPKDSKDCLPYVFVGEPETKNRKPESWKPGFPVQVSDFGFPERLLAWRHSHQWTRKIEAVFMLDPEWAQCGC